MGRFSTMKMIDVPQPLAEMHFLHGRSAHHCAFCVHLVVFCAVRFTGLTCELYEPLPGDLYIPLAEMRPALRCWPPNAVACGQFQKQEQGE